MGIVGQLEEAAKNSPFKSPLSSANCASGKCAEFPRNPLRGCHSYVANRAVYLRLVPLTSVSS